jgi:hypothetical protein
MRGVGDVPKKYGNFAGNFCDKESLTGSQFDRLLIVLLDKRNTDPHAVKFGRVHSGRL